MDEIRLDTRFYHNIVASPVSVRSSLSVPRDTGVNYIWVDFRYRVIVHGILCKRAREIVLDKHVTFLDKAVEDIYASRMLERKPHGSFVSVHLLTLSITSEKKETCLTPK